MKTKKRIFRNSALCLASGSFAAFLLLISSADSAFAFESAKFAIEELCGHMTGSLGGLLMSAAAVGGIAAAAFGNFRASFSFIITGIGAFTISALLSLYFPQAAQSCNGGGGAAGGGGPTGAVERRIDANNGTTAEPTTIEDEFGDDF